MSETPRKQKKELGEEVASGELILIIANRPKSFETAANFLSRRGYPCSVVADIKQALKIITERKPAYIFLSWNLKNAKILQTYNLFAKTFKKMTVVFAEATDSKTAAELANSGLAEIMQAPVSGPGMYMRIQKIVKAREEISQNIAGSEKAAAPIIAKTEDIPSEGTWESAGEDQKSGQKIWRFKSENSNHKGKRGVFTFKGEKPPHKDKKGQWKTEGDEGGEVSFEAIGTPAHQTFNHGPQEHHEEDRELSEQEIEAIASRIAQGKTGDEEADGFGTIMKLGAKKKDPKSPAITSSAEQKTREDMILQSGALPNTNELSATQQGIESKEHTIRQEGLKGKEYQATLEKTEGKEFEIQTAEKAKSKQNIVLGGAIGKGGLRGKNADSILAQVALKALEESVGGANGEEESAPLRETERCVVFTINSERFRGYFVAATSNRTSVDKKVIDSLKSKIAEHLAANGENLKEYQLVECFTEKFDFKGWSDNAAEFIALADHKAEQWGLAFFPTKETVPRVEVHVPGKMLAVDIQDVLPESKINFDLFIFLPMNNKHFLYVRRGQYLSQIQSERMKTGKVTRFYIKEEELQHFKDFCITNRINAYISDFRQSQPKAS